MARQTGIKKKILYTKESLTVVVRSLLSASSKASWWDEDEQGSAERWLSISARRLVADLKVDIRAAGVQLVVTQWRKARYPLHTTWVNREESAWLSNKRPRRYRSAVLPRY